MARGHRVTIDPRNGRFSRNRPRFHPDVRVPREHGARDVPVDAHYHRVARAGSRVPRPSQWIPHAKPTATTPHTRRWRQPGAVLPLGGTVAPVAPMCANVGQLFWRANCRQHCLVFIGGVSSGALRVVTCCHSALVSHTVAAAASGSPSRIPPPDSAP